MKKAKVKQTRASSRIPGSRAGARSAAAGGRTSSRARAYKAQGKANAGGPGESTGTGLGDLMADRRDGSARDSGKHAGGRPSKFGEVDLDQVEAIAAFGHTEEEIALILGIAPSTLALYKINHPEFLEVLRRGKLRADVNVERSLYSKALGKYACPHCGKPVPGPAADTTSIIFWLKNRLRRIWRDRQEVDAPEIEKALYELSEKFLPASMTEKTPASEVEKNKKSGHEKK